MDEYATVVNIAREKIVEEPPPLFDLTTLQIEANRRLGLSAAETLECAQHLYEAELLTYPRTSSHYITPDMERSVSELLSEAESDFASNTTESRTGDTSSPCAGCGSAVVEGAEIIRDGSQLEDGKLKPNCIYQTGEYEYIYKTDSEGRITSFSTENLKFTEREARLPHDKNTPGKEKGDHAGHLAGDRFGGSSQIDNLVSQASLVNLSSYKKLENQWDKALKNGRNVKVDVDVRYEGRSLRPSEFLIKYEIDGEAYHKTILNSG